MLKDNHGGRETSGISINIYNIHIMTFLDVSYFGYKYHFTVRFDHLIPSNVNIGTFVVKVQFWPKLLNECSCVRVMAMA